MSEKTFQNACWIGAEKRMLQAHMMSVFQFRYLLRILPGSSRASFLFGGNDSRLMDRDKNIQGAEFGKDQSYIELQLDITPLDLGKPAEFRVLRTGYKNDESGMTLLHSAELPDDILNQKNAHDAHVISIKCVYGEIEVHFDGLLLSKASRPFAGNVWNLNPVGAGNNYICFPLLCDIGLKLEPEEEAEFSGLEIRNYRKPESLLYAAFESGESFSGEADGFLKLWDPSYGGMTMLRTEFTLDKPVSEARLFATARGIYEVTLNGKKAGEDWFAPGLSQYNKTHYYQEYDVAALLKPGKNVWMIDLAEGWWSGAISFEGENWNYFGDRLSFLGALLIRYEDGSEARIVTNPDSFLASQDGPVRYGSLFQGEYYDFRKEEDITWEAAVEIPLSDENCFIGETIRMPFGRKDSLYYDDFKLLPDPARGVQVIERLTAKSTSEPRPGVYIYDFGQNIAGVPEVDFEGISGQKVTLRFAEILYPDMPEYAENAGMLMLENIRGALAQDTVILKDGFQTFCPHFTQHGYRYMEITGTDGPLPLESVRSIALSSVNVTSEFRCSDPLISRLFENVTWSLRDNFISIPTDCPQRNERMGWSGDISVFAPTALRMADCVKFLEKQLQALRDVQDPSGRFPDIAPLGGGFGGVLWGSAGITIPWELYKRTGDTAVLSDHFDSMCRYMRYLKTRLSARGIVDEGPLGDWLGPENRKNEPALLWQCYYVYDLDILIRAANILGRPETANEFREDYLRARSAFHEVFLDPETLRTVFSSEDAATGKGMSFGMPSPIPEEALPKKTGSGRYLIDTQTSYAVPLALGVFEPEAAEKAREYLREAVMRENIDDTGAVRPPYSLMTGFIGTAWILPALSDAGMDRLAFRMLRQAEYPSWLYPVKQGATTIWERLDSFTLERGFGGNNSMNSFNHYSFGAVAGWILGRMLGFPDQISEEGPVFSPMPDPDGVISWAEGSAVFCGLSYRVRWEQKPGETVYEIDVPEGGKAVLLAVSGSGSEGDECTDIRYEERKKYLLSPGMNRIVVH
ncbi:MAG: family 78 glycoside hydrolase catalytic domain [Lachnospiraceae bacterium]|nr:family 78 glycoside hydrolase catalytic domain [Lachnospiraceae bacterium]